MSNRSDNFNRADNAASLGTPSDGGSAWVSFQGTWGVASNQAYSPSAGNYDIVVLESGAADVTVAVTVPVVDQYPGIALRASDVNNLWAIYCVPNAINLYKRVAGTWSPYLGTYASGAQSGDRLQMVAQGDSISVLLTRAGTTTTIIPAVTDSFNNTATQHGLTTILSSLDRFDDFAVSVTTTATAYTLTGPDAGAVGAASATFSVTPNGFYTGTITVTPSGGGLSAPVSLTFNGTSAPQTFTITPTAAGAVTLTPAASPALGADPAPLTYVASTRTVQPEGGVQYLAVQTSSSGDTTLVAGVSGRRVVITQVYLGAASAVSLKFKSSGGTDLTGAVPIAAANQAPAWVDKAPAGLFDTPPGEGLVLNLGGAVAVNGYVGFFVF